MDYPAQRRERLARLRADEGIDALLISSPVNVTYLTGFTGESSVLLLSRDRTLLVSDPRYTGQLADECPGAATHIRPPSQKLPEAVAEVLEASRRPLGRLRERRRHRGRVRVPPRSDAEPGLEGRRRPRRAAARGQGRLGAGARSATAIDVAERAFTVFRALLRPEDTEKDLCDALEHYVRRAGGAGTSFPPIVAVGERAALPHAPPTDRRVDSGELLLVDWGVSGRCYKSDLTRVLATRTTAPFSGTAVDVRNWKRSMRWCCGRRRRRCGPCGPACPRRDMDAAARGVIAEAGYGDYFGHGLGHGIGLQIHEAPWLRPNSDTLVEAGMVFTIEPGIYLPGWGGVRIEDDVLVTPDGVELLTHLPRDLDAMRETSSEF